MLKMWEKALTEAEKDEVAKGMATFFRKHKMQTPATLFLEMHKPLSTVVGNAAIFFSPIIMPILGFERVDKYSRFFADRENVERLICEIEGQEESKSEQTP
jgi:hypothetical protein